MSEIMDKEKENILLLDKVNGNKASKLKEPAVILLTEEVNS